MSGCVTVTGPPAAICSLNSGRTEPLDVYKRQLAGLAEAAPGLDCGQLVSVYIKSIIPEKMKIKLVVLHAMRDETFAFPLEYRLHAGHIGRWIYSVPGAARVIETIFDG